MTLDDAIKHCQQVAKESDCDECANEHKQLAQWLQELKEFKKMQTNEEWFCGLSTEQKAKWLYDHYVNAREEEFYGRPEKTLYDYQKWLVDVHKGIDGTMVG